MNPRSNKLRGEGIGSWFDAALILIELAQVVVHVEVGVETECRAAA
jgi:hypothetical protein